MSSKTSDALRRLLSSQRPRGIAFATRAGSGGARALASNPLPAAIKDVSSMYSVVACIWLQHEFSIVALAGGLVIGSWATVDLFSRMLSDSGAQRARWLSLAAIAAGSPSGARISSPFSPIDRTCR